MHFGSALQKGHRLGDVKEAMFKYSLIQIMSEDDEDADVIQ